MAERGEIPNSYHIDEERFDTFRWASVNRSRKGHLWLGQATACGITNPSDLEGGYSGERCGKCALYLTGWIHRHDYGVDHAPGVPNPACFGTRLDGFRAGGGEQ